MAEIKNAVTTLKNNTTVLCKIKMYLPYDPAISLLGIYLRAVKSYVYIKTGAQMLVAAY